MAASNKDPNAAIPAWTAPVTDQQLDHINAAGNYLLHSVPCILWGFTLNNAINKATMTIYDGVDATGTVVGNFDIAASETSFVFPGGGWYLRKGCFITVTAAPDMTFVSAEKGGVGGARDLTKKP